MGLNESYTAVRGNILMMNPFPFLSQIYSLLVQEERQRQVKSRNDFQSEGASFATGAGLNNAPRNLFTKRPEGRRTSLFCEHCKRTGHTMDKCYKLHVYPNNNRQGGRGRTFKGANSAYGDQDSQTSTESIPIAAATSANTTLLLGLNQEQSKHLLQFLTNLTGGGEQKQLASEATASTASLHMASVTYAFNAIHSFCVLSPRCMDSGQRSK